MAICAAMLMPALSTIFALRLQFLWLTLQHLALHKTKQKLVHSLSLISAGRKEDQLLCQAKLLVAAFDSLCPYAYVMSLEAHCMEP